MLRQHLARVGAGVILVTACLVAVQSPAQADYIYCPPDSGPCYIVVEGPGGGNPGDPGGPGGGGGGVGDTRCIHEQRGEVDCYVGGMGWFNPIDACYYNRLTLAADDPLWEGDPANGDMYQVYCWGGLSAGWELVDNDYLTSEPPGYGGLIDLVIVINRAIAQLPLDLPTIQTVPHPASAGAAGLVGLPVWMWTTAPGWGPHTATASVDGISVTATGRVTHMEWRMGDGSSTINCASAGTPYTTDRKDDPSPDCGYKYLRPSREVGGGLYTVRGTAVWVVTWVGNNQSGQLPLERYSEVNLRINELQVVVQ